MAPKAEFSGRFGVNLSNGNGKPFIILVIVLCVLVLSMFGIRGIQKEIITIPNAIEDVFDHEPTSAGP